MTILEGRNLCKHFRERSRSVTALSDVSFTLDDGEILGIVGESGSGKSTLLRLISGLEAPDSGEILLEGDALPKKRTKTQYRAIQMIFQDAPASFHPRRSIAASIRESVRNLCGPGAPCDLASLSSRVGLDEKLCSRLPRDLSGGQCQRFAIARAIAVSPRILLCDEITSALDVSSQAQVLRLLADVCRENHMAAVFVSHDIAVVRCVCDRVMVLRSGRVVEQGAVRDVVESPKEDYTKELLASVLEVREAYMDNISQRVKTYWTQRARDFNTVRVNELRDAISGRWMAEMAAYLPAGRSLDVLDAGTGTGYFAILMAKAGHRVTGIDLTPAMLSEAAADAESEGVAIRFLQMDAQATDFPDDSFDAVVTRNLTWTLPDPAAAYREWRRILRPGGVLLNFDAPYAENVRNNNQRKSWVTEKDVYGHIGITPALSEENAEITLAMPASAHPRPAWDLELALAAGFAEAEADETAGKRILEERDLADAPMFLLRAQK